MAAHPCAAGKSDLIRLSLIIIPQSSKAVDIVFCELKKTGDHDKVKEASKQIKFTMPLVRYIQSAAEIHCNSQQGVKIGEVKNLIVLEQMTERLKKSISKQQTLRMTSQKYRYQRDDDQMEFCVITNTSQIRLRDINVSNKTPQFPRN